MTVILALLLQSLPEGSVQNLRGEGVPPSQDVSSHLSVRT